MLSEYFYTKLWLAAMATAGVVGEVVKWLHR